MQELLFLHSARRLMLIDICMKFREDSFRGFQVTERTRFVTDRQTDGRSNETVFMWLLFRILDTYVAICLCVA